MKNYIKLNPNSNLASKFSFNINDIAKNEIKFEWEEEGEEFKLNGEMYDVVELKQSGLQLEIIALKDDDESKLIDAYCNLYGKTSNQKSTAINLLKFFSSPFIPNSNNNVNITVNNNLQHTEIYQVQYCNNSITILTPPPKFSKA